MRYLLVADDFPGLQTLFNKFTPGFNINNLDPSYYGRVLTFNYLGTELLANNIPTSNLDNFEKLDRIPNVIATQKYDKYFLLVNWGVPDTEEHLINISQILKSQGNSVIPSDNFRKHIQVYLQSKKAPPPEIKVELPIVKTEPVIKPVQIPQETKNYGQIAFPNVNVKNLFWPMNSEESKMLVQIKKLVKQILINWGITDDVASAIVADEYSGYWLACFTREDYNPNNRLNLEAWETLGDTVMSTCLAQMLIEKYPDLLYNNISDYIEFYLQKPEQAKEAAKLGLQNVILTNRIKDVSVYEDALEAFFGVLFEVGNLAFPQGMDGLSLCRIATCKIYGNREYISSGLSNNAANLFKEIFEKLGYRDILEEAVIIQRGGTKIVYRIIVPVEIRKDIHDKYKDQVGDIPEILTSYESSVREKKKVAKRMAYRRAVNELRKIGIDWKWADEQKKKVINKDLDESGLYQDFRKLLESENYDPDFYEFNDFDTYSEDTKYKLVQLIVKEKNSIFKKILVGKLYKSNDKTYIVDLIQSAIAGQRGTSLVPPQ